MDIISQILDFILHVDVYLSDIISRYGAWTLALSEGTVKNHISAILAKLHANDRTQAVVIALKHELVDLG